VDTASPPLGFYNQGNQNEKGDKQRWKGGGGENRGETEGIPHQNMTRKQKIPTEEEKRDSFRNQKVEDRTVNKKGHEKSEQMGAQWKSPSARSRQKVGV